MTIVPTQIDNTPSDLSDRFARIEEELSDVKTTAVGQEHRLFQVFSNAFKAFRNSDSWSSERRAEAFSSLLRYLFLGRTTVILTVGIGGILALHASFMLAEQTRKMDLENYLATVSSELAEAQRNSQFVQLIAPLVADLQRLSEAGQSSATDERNRSGQQVFRLDVATATRVAALTQTFQPYRWIVRDMGADQFLRPKGEGPLYTLMSWIRHVYDLAFGRSVFDETSSQINVPVLTEFRQSPERGLLLITLPALRLDFNELTRFNATFESAFAPGARLEAIDLGGLAGPDLSEPMDLGLANFAGGSFKRAYLQNVLFILSNLTLASFDGANLIDASLRGANADQASFVAANLSGVDLRDAYIGDADFRLADLSGANLTTARSFQDAKLQDSCLSKHSTLLPGDFDWAAYRVPTDCCSQWQMPAHSHFILQSEACVASPDDQHRRTNWN